MMRRWGKAIRIIADKVVEKLDLREGVIVHCAGGRGRGKAADRPMCRAFLVQLAFDYATQLEVVAKCLGRARQSRLLAHPTYSSSSVFVPSR